MKTITLIFPLLLFSPILPTDTFKSEQMKQSRVKEAYTEKWPELKKELKEKKLDTAGFSIFIRAFKQEEKLELWIKPKTGNTYTLFKTYSICASSGDLGPKRRQGDGQVPEGFYDISAFNPWSNFHLSLKVNYPNASDRILGKGNLGGDIMIHGSCVTIGCIPLRDEKIKEVYVLAVEAKNNGHSIPVHIFPCRMNDENFSALKKKHEKNTTLLRFWENIKTGYDAFEKNKTIPHISVDKNGIYIFA